MSAGGIRRRRAGTALIAAALSAVLGLACVPASQADPTGTPTYRQLAGVGADSPAGLMDAISNDITVNGVKVLGSYDPLGSQTIQTKSSSACAAVPRYDGSVAGRQGLITSQYTHDGCIQFSTSSILNLAQVPSGGPQLSYVPFAWDAVTYAITSTNTTIPRQLSLDELKGIYRCDPSIVGTAPNYAIDAVLPQPGSGLRAFWEGWMGILDSDVLAGKYACIRDTSDGLPIGQNNTYVEEEDGRVLRSTSIVPFSIPAYLDEQAQLVQDERGDAMLGSIDGVTPTEPNPAFPASFGGYTYAVNSASIAIPRELSTTDLQRIYHCDPAYVGTSPNYTLQPMIPAQGTARTAWESAMGITDAQLTAGQLPCIDDGGLRTPVVADNGRQLMSGNQLMPYSIAVYEQQTSQQVQDLHGNAELGTIDNIGPQIYTPTFSVQRQLYNVIPTADTQVAPYSSVFVGANSLICGETALIVRYGFTTNSDCGDPTQVTAP